ncbi:MAG: hypothetical protein KGI29_02040 [Pseudomonadota bacterium]|nr:hypothetical protein [Pseudomonadota bacterium]
MVTGDQTLTATEASRSFSELLHRVCYGGESFVIKKGQRLMARIAPVESEESKESSSSERAAPPDSPEETPPPDMTADEAEFYRAWMEQVRKVDA